MLVTQNRFNAPQRIARNTQNNRNNVAFGCCHCDRPSDFPLFPIAMAVGLLAGLAGILTPVVCKENAIKKQIIAKAPTAGEGLIAKVDSIRKVIQKTPNAKNNDVGRDYSLVLDSLNGGKSKPLTALSLRASAYRSVDSLTNSADSLWKAF